MKTKYFKKYLVQKDKIPEEYREKIKEEIIFYCLSDYDSEFQAIEKWIAVTSSSVFICENSSLVKIEFDEMSVREVKGRSFSNISILKNEKVVHTFWYGQKQATLFSQLKYILEEKNLDISKSAEEIYQMGLLKPLLKKQASVEVDKNKVVKRLLGYLKPYRKELFFGGLGALGATLVSLLPAYLSGKVVDDIIKPFQDGKMKAEDGMSLGLIIIGTLAFIYAIREFFIWLRLKKMSILGEKVARDLRRDLFNHIQKLDMDFFANNQTGSIISRVSSDTDRIWDFVAFGVIEVSIALITLFSLSTVLISLDLQLGLIMTLPTPLLIYAIYRHGEKMKLMFLKCWRKWADLTAVLSDAIPGMQVVKSFNQESREVKRFGEKNEAAVEEFYSVHESWTKFWPVLFLFVQAMMISVWFFAMPRLLIDSSSATFITAGTFISFLLYMNMFAQPIEIIGQMARMLNRASSSAYRIFEILDTKPSLETSEVKVEKTLQGEIEFKDVIFSYDGVRNVLKGINLNIKPGEMIGLVGPSGSGKSTITKLINRFYDVTSGSIDLDGVSIKEIDAGFMRRQIGIVHQDPYLFHGSILDNIRYGNEDATFFEIIKACKIANAHEFIMGFANSYDTIVGERGQTLSGGERQRVSIARAILNNPKILIFDEATSAVDTETERKIQDALDKLIEGRTVIAIAHRLSTLRKANRILVVKKGQIVEQGSHSDLMQMSGEYKKLQDMQTQMHEIMHGSQTKEEV